MRTKQRKGPDLAEGDSRLTLKVGGSWWFRVLAAIGVPLLMILAGEGILRLAGFGYSTRFFQERPGRESSFLTDNQDFGRRFFPPGLVRYPKPFAFPAVKEAGTIRIFVLGESAAMGDPDPKFGLARMLQVLLRERFPGRKFEVVNAAMVAVNSHVIVPIARECAQHQGDLWVVYMGNNEVIGPYGAASVFGAKAPPLAAVRAAMRLKSTRVGQLFDAGLNVIVRGRGIPSDWRGMEMMAGQRARYDDASLARVHQSFERNLSDILESGIQSKVPVLLCTVATNLRDCPPFASLHRANLSAKELAEWQTAYDAGIVAEEGGDPQTARLAYERAIQIDGDFADLNFRLARCYHVQGQEREAAKFFREARDKDALQFRADTRLNTAIRSAAARLNAGGVRLLDAENLFATNSPAGLTGREYFYEHVHMTPEGNYLLARAVADQAANALGLQSSADWIPLTECLRQLGFTDGNRYEALDSMRDRMQVAPFTGQIDHARQLQDLDSQLARYRMANKPAQVRRDIGAVSQMVARYPEDPDLRWNLAVLLENGGDAAGAEEQWRATIRLQPQAALPRINLAKLLERVGRQPEALTLYVEGLRINPEYFPARFALGLLCLGSDRPAEAIYHLGLAARQRPEAADVRLALGQAFFRANRRRSAEKEFREVLRIDPGNVAAQEQLRAVSNSR